MVQHTADTEGVKPVFPLHVLSLVVTSLTLGVAGDLLFQDADWGINVVLGLVLLVAAIVFLQRRSGVPPPVGARRIALQVLLPALLMGGGFALRASSTLLTLSGLALIVCILLGARGLRTGRGWEPGILGSLGSLLKTGWESLSGGLRFLRFDVPASLSSHTVLKTPHGRAAGRGILLAIPLLLVFGGLLASADPIFAHDLSLLFQWDLTAVWVRCAWTVFGVCAAGGFLRFLLEDVPKAAPQPKPVGWFSLGSVETAIILGALDTLFFLFVLVQFRYFFGGQETILATVGMTYAAYARHGFFELVTVAGLTLPLLLTLHTGQARQGAGSEILFRSLAGLLVVFLFVIMASALARMNLYRSAYGLTELRVYTTAFMGWLALVFVWFSVTVLRGQRGRFTAGAFVSACAVIVLLFAWNPDARIVHANAVLSQAGHRFDAGYAASLSADAVPELVADLGMLRPADQQVVATDLLQQWPAPSAGDWRAWCWGRRQAQQSLARSRARLLALSKAGASPTSRPSAPSATETLTQVAPEGDL